jgi:hypothetical protein
MEDHVKRWQALDAMPEVFTSDMFADECRRIGVDPGSIKSGRNADFCHTAKCTQPNGKGTQTWRKHQTRRIHPKELFAESVTIVAPAEKPDKVQFFFDLCSEFGLTPSKEVYAAFERYRSY